MRAGLVSLLRLQDTKRALTRFEVLSWLMFAGPLARQFLFQASQTQAHYVTSSPQDLFLLHLGVISFMPCFTEKITLNCLFLGLSALAISKKFLSQCGLHSGHLYFTAECCKSYRPPTLSALFTVKKCRRLEKSKVLLGSIHMTQPELIFFDLIALKF